MTMFPLKDFPSLRDCSATLNHFCLNVFLCFGLRHGAGVCRSAHSTTKIGYMPNANSTSKTAQHFSYFVLEGHFYNGVLKYSKVLFSFF